MLVPVEAPPFHTLKVVSEVDIGQSLLHSLDLGKQYLLDRLN